MMKLPGSAWVALIVALSAWLQETFHDPWVTGAVVVLGMVAKLIELYWPAPEPTATERMMAAKNPPSKTARWLLGG